MTRTDAPEGPINRIYRNGNYVTQMDAVGPDVFKVTILNAKTTAEHVVGEENYRNMNGERRYLSDRITGGQKNKRAIIYCPL